MTLKELLKPPYAKEPCSVFEPINEPEPLRWIRKEYGNTGLWYLHCPSCDFSYFKKDYMHYDILPKHYNYCPNCGVRLLPPEREDAS